MLTNNASALDWLKRLAGDERVKAADFKVAFKIAVNELRPNSSIDAGAIARLRKLHYLLVAKTGDHFEFHTGEAPAAANPSPWKSWFAWRPVYVGNKLSKDGMAGRLGFAWLTRLERRPAAPMEGGSVRARWLYRTPGAQLGGVAGQASSK